MLTRSWLAFPVLLALGACAALEGTFKNGETRQSPRKTAKAPIPPESHFCPHRVEVAPDVPVEFQAQAIEDGYAQEHVDQLLGTLDERMRDRLYDLASDHPNLVVYDVSAQECRPGEWRANATLLTLSVVEEQNGNTLSGGKIADAAFEKLQFRACVNVKLVQDGLVLASGDGIGSEDYVRAQRMTIQEAGSGVDEPDLSNDRQVEATLGGPTKRCVQRAVDAAWNEALRRYSEKVRLAEEEAPSSEG